VVKELQAGQGEGRAGSRNGWEVAWDRNPVEVRAQEVPPGNPWLVVCGRQGQEMVQVGMSTGVRVQRRRKESCRQNVLRVREKSCRSIGRDRSKRHVHKRCIVQAGIVAQAGNLQGGSGRQVVYKRQVKGRHRNVLAVVVKAGGGEAGSRQAGRRRHRRQQW